MRMRKWLSKGHSVGYPFEHDQELERTEITDFLESNGYTILANKKKVSLRMKVNNETYSSRFFIDYIVRKDEQWYVVKIDRDRKPFEWTGSAVRDSILPYYMQFPDSDGVIIVNMRYKDLKVITFEFK